MQQDDTRRILNRVRTRHGFPHEVETFTGRFQCLSSEPRCSPRSDELLPVLTTLRETAADMRYETSAELSATAVDVQELLGQYMATSVNGSVARLNRPVLFQLILDGIDAKVRSLEKTVGWS